MKAIDQKEFGSANVSCLESRTDTTPMNNEAPTKVHAARIKARQLRSAAVRSALRYDADCPVAAIRLIIIAITFYWLLSGKLPWVMVGAVCVVLTYLPAACIQDPALRAASSLCVSALLFAHIVFGMEAGFYETSTIYDKVIHLLGCSAIAGLVIAAISQYCRRKGILLPLPLFLLLVIGAVVSLGTLWELFEFAIDRTGLFQTQKGLTDTMLDLMADTLGAMAAMIVYVMLARRNIRVTS